MADRLRAEAEEELMALQTGHEDTKRELAVAQQRQKEADLQLVTLREELKESKQRLAALTNTQGKTGQEKEPERANGDSADISDCKEVSRRGRERVLYRLGREGTERRGQNEVSTKNVVSEEARTPCKSVTKRYLRNVTNEDRSGGEVRAGDTPKTPTTERSR